MNLLLDTHLLLWAAGEPSRLSQAAMDLMQSPKNVLWFSAVNIWEVVIKNSLGRPDFHVDAHLLRRGLLENQYRELPMDSRHALTVSRLPALHRDPFDRMLIAQAESEGFVLLTADDQVGRYGSPVKRV
jgi:PIN domain nuclease of toxin-antitoxin system